MVKKTTETGLQTFVEDIADLKTRLNELPAHVRRKFLAYLSTTMTQAKVSELTGADHKTIQRARKEHPELVEGASITRNVVVAEMAEKKAFDILQTLDVAEIPDAKKPSAAKALMDVSAKAYLQIEKDGKDGDDDETTAEILVRIKRRMRDKAKRIIDVEAITDEEQDDEGGGQPVSENEAEAASRWLDSGQGGALEQFCEDTSGPVRLDGHAGVQDGGGHSRDTDNERSAPRGTPEEGVWDGQDSDRLAGERGEGGDMQLEQES